MRYANTFVWPSGLKEAIPPRALAGLDSASAKAAIVDIASGPMPMSYEGRVTNFLKITSCLNGEQMWQEEEVAAMQRDERLQKEQKDLDGEMTLKLKALDAEIANTTTAIPNTPPPTGSTMTKSGLVKLNLTVDQTLEDEVKVLEHSMLEQCIVACVRLMGDLPTEEHDITTEQLSALNALFPKAGSLT